MGRPIPAETLSGKALHDAFMLTLRKKRIDEPELEFRFAPPRRWRFDYAWPDHYPPVALEVEGGIWTRGRHTRGAGYAADLEKYNEAALRGYRLFRVTPQQLCTDYTIRLLTQMGLANPF